MSLQELIAQKEALEQQIEQARAASRIESVAKVRALMDENGLTVADLSVKRPSLQNGNGHKVVRKAPVKYRDPATGATWSGRGLAPKWLVASGRDRSEFAV